MTGRLGNVAKILRYSTVVFSDVSLLDALMHKNLSLYRNVRVKLIRRTKLGFVKVLRPQRPIFNRQVSFSVVITLYKLRDL
jgi:hypothetical protein